MAAQSGPIDIVKVINGAPWRRRRRTSLAVENNGDVVDNDDADQSGQPVCLEEQDRKRDGGRYRNQAQAECKRSCSNIGDLEMPIDSQELFASGVSHVAARLGMAATRLLKQKNKIKGYVEVAITSSASLLGCTVEVVGSTATGCDILQSDLDLLLLTRNKKDYSRNAVDLLKDLQSNLHALPGSASAFTRVELRVHSRVPILVLSDQNGITCDISVDQCHALDHRDFLRDQLRDRPKIRDVIRLVKLWLRRRGLPGAAEGGIPSLAWAIIALRITEGQPNHFSVESLLRTFFFELRLLRTMHLSICNNEGDLTMEWQRRSSLSSWQGDYMQLLSVEDPALQLKGESNAHAEVECHGFITPNTIPTALAALYTAEFDLAWNAAQCKRWGEVFKPAPSSDLSMSPGKSINPDPSTLHVFLKDGAVHLGRIVNACPSYRALQQEMFHRRDTESELVVQSCELDSRADDCTSVDVNEGADLFVVRPCHWVCGLDVNGAQVLPGDGITRIQKVKTMMKILSTSTTAKAEGEWNLLRYDRPLGIPRRTQASDANAGRNHHSRHSAARGRHAPSNYTGESAHQCESAKRLRKKAKNRAANARPRIDTLEAASEAAEEFRQQARGDASVAAIAWTSNQTQSVPTHAPLAPCLPIVSLVWMVPANGVFVCPAQSLEANGQSVAEGVPAKLQSNLSLGQDKDRTISDLSTQASDSGGEFQIQ